MTGTRRPRRAGVTAAATALGALLLAGCAAAEDPGAAEPPAPARSELPAASTAPAPPAPATPATPTPPPATPTPALPAVAAWEPAPAEVRPAVKLAATRVLEALGNPDPAAAAADPRAAAADRLAAVGADPGLAASAGPLVPPAAAAVSEVVYPQYGGLTPSASAVMAVVRQDWVEAGRVRSRTVTADVRLERSGDSWEVTELLPAPQPAPGPLPDRVRALVEGGRIELPDVAVAELASGDVSPRVLDALEAVASRHTAAVAVLRGGHPIEVFGTDRTSNHTRGRAVDLWAIDGVPVVELAPDDPRLISVLRLAERAGSTEIGSPVDLDGPGGTFFSDDLHRDHVHIGFDA